MDQSGLYWTLFFLPWISPDPSAKFEECFKILFEFPSAQIDFTSEVFDQNADVSSSIFTAPITGRYLFSAMMGCSASYTDDDPLNFILETSNQGYYAVLGGDLTTLFTWTISIVTDMDASDTAQVQIYNIANRGAIETGIGSVWFSGCLLA